MNNKYRKKHIHSPLCGIFQRASAHEESLKLSVLAAVNNGENPPGVGTGSEVAPRVPI